MAQIGNYGAAIAGYMLLWSLNSSDYTVYFPPGVSRFVGSHNDPRRRLTSNTISWRLFLYSYLGLVLPTVRDSSNPFAEPQTLTTHRFFSKFSVLPQRSLPLLCQPGKQAILTITLVDF